MNQHNGLFCYLPLFTRTFQGNNVFLPSALQAAIDIHFHVTRSEKTYCFCADACLWEMRISSDSQLVYIWGALFLLITDLPYAGFNFVPLNQSNDKQTFIVASYKLKLEMLILAFIGQFLEAISLKSRFLFQQSTRNIYSTRPPHEQREFVSNFVFLQRLFHDPHAACLRSRCIF
jgi:hypothetical protein